MCYTTTPYFTLCQHYGRPALCSPPCIRALSQPGHLHGCPDKQDQGVRSIAALCPTCDRTAASTTTSSSASSSSASASSRASTPPLGCTSTSGRSTPARRTLLSDRVDAAADARRLLAMLPSHVRTVPRNAFGVGLKMREPEWRG